MNPKRLFIWTLVVASVLVGTAIGFIYQSAFTQGDQRAFWRLPSHGWLATSYLAAGLANLALWFEAALTLKCALTWWTGRVSVHQLPDSRVWLFWAVLIVVGFVVGLVRRYAQRRGLDLAPARSSFSLPALLASLRKK